MSFEIKIDSRESLMAVSDGIAAHTKLSGNALRTAIAKYAGCDHITGLISRFEATSPYGYLVNSMDDDNGLEVFVIPSKGQVNDYLKATVDRFGGRRIHNLDDIISEGQFEYAKGYVAVVTECDGFYQCDNCGHLSEYDSLPDAKDIEMRLSPGGTHTDKECPHCHALCFPVELKDVAENISAIDLAGKLLPKGLASTNGNCLTGMCCPKCLFDIEFIIETTGYDGNEKSVEMLHWEDDGSYSDAMPSSMDFDDADTCICTSCDHEARVKDFRNIEFQE